MTLTAVNCRAEGAAWLRNMAFVINVLTWNVLHRVHAENWEEPVVVGRPDEAERIAAITARVAGRSERIVALQEVSGDQLDSLRAALGDRRGFHVLCYPRVPEARRAPAPLRDRREFLVLLVEGPAESVAAEAFEDEPGKGFVAVRVGGVLVIGTHVGFGALCAGHLARVAELAAAEPVPAVLLGDFNADAETVGALLGSEFTVLEPAVDAIPTRPGVGGGPVRHIDHVVVRAPATGRDVVVEDAGGLSDHNLVRAMVEAQEG